MIKYLILPLCIALYSCGQNKQDVSDELNVDVTEDQDLVRYCDSIDKVILYFKLNNYTSTYTSNQNINSIVPLLIAESNIPSTCDKGTSGYLYFNYPDSVFYNDVRRWLAFFECDP